MFRGEAGSLSETRSAFLAPPRNRLVIELLTVIVFSGFLFFYGLGAFGLVGADEPRYAQVAREMLQSGDFVTPRLHGEVWLEKPVLYYWQAALAFRLFGVHDWAARMPSATCAMAMVLAIFFHLRRLHPGVHVEAALLTAGSAAVLGFARGASMDMPLSACFTIAMLGWYAFYRTGARFFLLECYFFLGLGTLAKGPVAPGLAAFIILAFTAVRKDWRLLAKTIWLPAVACYCVVVVPWYAAVQKNNPEFFRVFLFEHNLERFATNRYQHLQPFWYYLVVLALSLMPWTVVGFAALGAAFQPWFKTWRGSSIDVRASDHEGLVSRDGFTQFLIIWAIFPVLFFSLSQSKLPGYILPAIPAYGILTGEFLYRRLKPRPLALLIHALLSGGMVGAVLLLPRLLAYPHRLPPAYPLLIAAGVAVGTTLFLFFGIRRIGAGAIRTLTFLPLVFSVWFVLQAAGPNLNDSYSARSVNEILQMLPVPEKTVAVFRVRRDLEYGLGFYRDQSIPSYDRGEIPASAHVLLTRDTAESEELRKMLGARHPVQLADFPPQNLKIYWIPAG